MGLPSGLYTFVGGATPAASDWNTNPTVFKNILSGNVDQDNVTTSGSKGVLTIADTQTITGTKTFTVTNTSGIATFTSQSVHTGGLKSGSSIISDTTNTDTLGTSAVTWADLYLGDGAVAYFGEDQDVSLTHTADTGLHLNAGMKLGFRDLGGEYIYSVADGTLGIVAATELDITTTTVDINGALDVSGNIVSGGEIDAVTLDISGDVDIDGTTNLDAVDIDGAVQLDSTLTVGANDQGYDVILYGDTASANLTWDTSVDDLIWNGAARAVIPDSQLVLGSTAVTTTGAEINLIDGGTSRGTTAVASGDGILINDAGTMRMTNVDTVSTYFSSHNVGGTNIVTVGTIGTGTWQGTAIASAYLDSDTAHLSGTQTFSGAKTFSAAATIATGSTVGNLTLANGSITDSSGAISFGNENLTTTGTLAAGATTIGGTLDFNSGTIDLSTQTVDVTLNAAVDALNFDSNTLSIDATNNRVGIGTSAPLSSLHVATAAADSEAVRITNSHNSAAGPYLEFYKDRAGDSGAGQDGDQAGAIDFYSEDSWGNPKRTAIIQSYITDSEQSSVDGDLRLSTVVGGTLNHTLTIAGGQVDIEGSGHTAKIGKAGTAATWFTSYNDGNTLHFGVEDSNGADIAVGSSAYSGIISSGDSSRALEIATAGKSRLKINSNGMVDATSDNKVGYYGKRHTFDALTMADDATVTLSSGGAGAALLIVYEHGSGVNALYYVGYGVTPVLMQNYGSTWASADTDGNYCVITSGHTTTFKNRIGAEKTFSITLFSAGLS